MPTARKYQRFSARCLEEARATIDPGLKGFLAEMAREWQRLADEAKTEKLEQSIAGGPEIDPGD